MLAVVRRAARRSHAVHPLVSRGSAEEAAIAEEVWSNIPEIDAEPPGPRE
jgi:hypothetical protein